jgi:hypothetical protein
VADNFGPIRPAPDSDDFAFDFTDRIGATGVIDSAVWTCEVSPNSLVTDPSPASRILLPATYSDKTTTSRIGNMIDGVIYTLTARITLTDGRNLSKSADVECTSNISQPVQAVPGSASFDYDAWVMRYPEFEGVSPSTAQMLWNEATLFLVNDGSSPVTDVSIRAVLLNMLTAHLAILFAGPGGAGGMVGRINSKSVNGVSVSAEGFGGVSGTASWYLTTRYGADYWKATAAFRTMQYIPGPTRPMDVWPYRRGFGF